MAETALYPAKTLANLFNLTERRIQQLAKDGVIPKAERGKYELVGSVRGYIKYLQDRAFGKDATVTDYHLHKSRLVKESADKAEMENQVARSELVALDDIAAGIDKMFSDVRLNLLALPTRLAPALIRKDNPAEIKDAIESGLYEAMNDISEFDPSTYLVQETTN